MQRPLFQGEGGWAVRIITQEGRKGRGYYLERGRVIRLRQQAHLPLGVDLLRQQQLDGGRSNAAFIVDHNTKTIGLIRESHYATHHLPTGRHELVWADFTRPMPAGGVKPMPDEQAALTRGFYETARFLLRNNQKTEPMKGPR